LQTKHKTPLIGSGPVEYTWEDGILDRTGFIWRDEMGSVIVDVFVGFDSVVCLILVSIAVAGYQKAKPHVEEFKSFSRMMGIGKK
jgi:hypothetical protein